MSMSKLLSDYVPGKGRTLIISKNGKSINVWFSLECPLFKHPGVSLKLFGPKYLTNALWQQHWHNHCRRTTKN